jgi:hypothetical protein
MQRHTQAQRELSTGFPQIYQHPEACSAVCDPGALRYNARLVLDDLTPSNELISAVSVERERLDRVAAMLHEEQSLLEAQLEAVRAQLVDVAGRREQLAHFLGEDSDHDGGTSTGGVAKTGPSQAGEGQLRGGAIRKAAVRAALAQDLPEQPRHYRDWLTLIEDTGDTILGQDAAATLLTQLSRCPLIVRALEPGTYRLDRDALVRLHQQHDALRAEAGAQVANTNDRDYDVIDLAQALAAIEARVRRIDRAIKEATDLVERLDADWFFADPAAENGIAMPGAVAA